nr:hypothetical protein [Prosthecomicrobium hirschii]
MPLAPDLLAVAPRVVWFETPEQALADPIRFMAYVMTHGTPEDVAVLRRYVGEDGFREAIENAPPGILDARSWAYWNIMAGHDPVPPMPVRRLPE